MGTTSQTAEASEAHFCVPPLRNGALSVVCWFRREDSIAPLENRFCGRILAYLWGSSKLD
jgi:hypothetical protein